MSGGCDGNTVQRRRLCHEKCLVGRRRRHKPVGAEGALPAQRAPRAAVARACRAHNRREQKHISCSAQPNGAPDQALSENSILYSTQPEGMPDQGGGCSGRKYLSRVLRRDAARDSDHSLRRVCIATHRFCSDVAVDRSQAQSTALASTTARAQPACDDVMWMCHTDAS